MNFISAGNHPESYLSGSTVESMINRAIELGLKYFTITDNGYMTSFLRGHMYGKDKDIQIIPGIEIYFKDSDCKLVFNTPSNNIKYYKLVIHAQDQEAYQKLALMNSDSTKKRVNISGNKYHLFNWKDLEELSAYNITVCNSNVEDLVTKHLLVNNLKVGIQYFQKLLGIFNNKYYPSIVPYQHDQYWNTMVEVKLNGKQYYIPANDRVETDHYDQAKAIELTRRGNRHKKLLYIYVNKVRYKVAPEYQTIQSATLINQFQPLPTGDIQTKANKFILGLAQKYGLSNRILINNYSYYASEGDRVVQDMKLGGEVKVHQLQHMRSTEDIKDYFNTDLGLNVEQIDQIVQNTHNWAKLFDNFQLKYDYRLPTVVGKPEDVLMQIIKKNNRMKWDNPEYVKRFREEFDLLTNNGVINLIPYFLPIVDVYDFYKDNGYLTGPARGSGGGSLIAYLIGITHVDPIKHGLFFSRFLTLDRIQSGNLPDLDSDLESRIPLVGKDNQSGYLYSKYGKKAAQVSTRTLLRIKSAILDANRFINKGKVEESIEVFSKSLPTTPQGVNDGDYIFGYEDNEGNHHAGLLETNDELLHYAESRPEEWNIVKRSLSLPRQNSRHACAFVIADCPIENVIPVFEVAGVSRVTQPEAKQVEFAGLIKYDFLVVSSIKDIRMALDYINAKNKTNIPTGYFMDNGKETFIWDLPEDPEVYKMLHRGQTETVFQLNTVSVTPFVKRIKPKSVLDCSVITSLVRPGPLNFIDEETGRNMVEEYCCRREGTSRGKLEILNQMLPETYGVLCFQEQITHLAKELAHLNVIDSENIRIAVGKKKKKLIDSLKPKFIDGAAKKVGVEIASEIWGMIEKFVSYGFNKCISGDTKLLRNKNANQGITVAEMYKARNNPAWAKDNGRESVGSKYRSFGYGKSFSMRDGRLHPNKIVDIRYEGIREVFRIVTKSGKNNKFTGNHRFPTPNGDKMLSELKVGDLLYTNGGYSAYGEKGLDCILEEIVSIESCGQEEVYDVEMEAPNHTFTTEEGIVTCNSHAVAYSIISYACAYLKYYYPLEWWAAVLSNASDKEINEEFYKYVKDMVLPPDINLSTETISIDYNNNKLRNKLSMICGLGTKAAEKIIAARPYKDLQDFVNKKVCGVALSRKLVHVGVLDSLFDPEDTLLSKMKKYENALQVFKFTEQINNYDFKIGSTASPKEKQKLTINKQKLLDKGPGPSKVDPLYVGLTPVRDFQIKKSIFPSMGLDLNKILLSGCSAKIIKQTNMNFIYSPRGEEFPFFNGEVLQKIDCTEVQQFVKFCVPGYIVDMSEFTYSKGTKKALKMIIDSSGYISEKVVWPDYNTGALKYPDNLKNGSVCLFYYYKKPGSSYTNILEIIVESPSLD